MEDDQYLARLSTAERKLLQLSVHINPMLVASVDGSCSLRETAAMTDAMHKLKTETEYRPLLLLAGHEEISDAALRVMLETHSGNIEGYLAKIAALLDRVPDDVAEAYRRFVLYSVFHVAEASRGGLFGLVGAKISDSEKLVIRMIVEVLRLVLSDHERTKLST